MSKVQPMTIRIAFLDVGQADTIVVTSPSTHEAIVIDCVDAKAVVNYLISEEVKYLRGVFITHLHADHYDQVANLLINYHVVPGMTECDVLALNEISKPKNVYKLAPDADGHSSDFIKPIPGISDIPLSSLENLVEWSKRNPLKCSEIKVEKRPLPIEGELANHIKLVHPFFVDYAELKSTGLNNTSAVLYITNNGSSALLTGDLEPIGWKYLQAKYPELQADVLKFPHHGSWKDADVDTFLDAVNPSIVVISVGTEGERYKHPNTHVFTSLAKRPDIQVLCTEATNQCQESVLSVRESVINTFKSNAKDLIYQPLRVKRNSCPCAGTIIVELDSKAQVLQPKTKFHQEDIIKPHFKNCQCKKLEYKVLGSH